jgi:hypothetical protein
MVLLVAVASIVEVAMPPAEADFDRHSRRELMLDAGRKFQLN